MGNQIKSSSRTYEKLWHEIKTKRKCSIKPANSSDVLFNRIKNAVIKEKCRDLAFKFGLDDKRSKLEIVRTESGIITFRLTTSIGYEDV
jgi:hypothetical protein